MLRERSGGRERKGRKAEEEKRRKLLGTPL
jgi:hypothetical protein